jgi:hypothetical protein
VRFYAKVRFGSQVAVGRPRMDFIA